jgi:hypothetical protein
MRHRLKSILIIILMLSSNFNVNSQIINDSLTQQIYGNWEFKYLLLNNKIKTWKISADKKNWDYMNIYFRKDTFDVQGTLIMRTGKVTINNEFLFFMAEDSIDDIIPQDLSTDYRKNLDWTRRFFKGKCHYNIESGSILELYKTSDSTLVFKKFY